MIERDPNLACDWCEFGEVSSRRQPCCDCWVASQLSKVIRFEIAADVARAVESEMARLARILKIVKGDSE